MDNRRVGIYGWAEIGYAIIDPLVGQGLYCHVCAKEAMAEPWAGWEVDEYGDTWVYCQLCDVWTAHPPETVEKYYDEKEETFGSKDATIKC